MSTITTNSLAWSVNLKALVKSIYSRYILGNENLESSKMAVSIWICLLVHLSCLKPSWLLCRI